jgi:hypothetical protein
MRLRLFDRIRRLVQRRGPQPDTASGAQGKHRRAHRSAGPAPAEPAPFPDPAASSGPPSSAAPSRNFAPADEDFASAGEHRRTPPGEWIEPDWPGSAADPSQQAADWPRSAADPSQQAGDWSQPGGNWPTTPGEWPASPVTRSHRVGPVSGSPTVRAGAARARIREAPPPGTDAARPASPGLPGSGPHGHDAIRPSPAHAAGAGRADTRADARADARAADLARVAAGVPRQPDGPSRASWRAAGAALRTRLPFTAPHARERPLTADGRRNCGSIERILWRQWDAAAPPPAEVIEAVDRLAELPERIKERLADGLDAIFIGPGGVPELDDMTGLRGVPLPAGRATWDACAGAYGERKIVVGSQPSPTPDVMCHEVGHALDDLDSPPGKWQSDSAEFRMVYEQCQPHLASDFHHQPGGLGRKEFFADAFAAIASRQRPALVDMLGGDTRTALRVMLYFNRRYGI